MAGVLRIAGGLDRSHNQNVRSVSVARNGDRLVLSVDAAQYPEVDLWACRSRSSLFEKVFDAELVVEWAGEPAATGASG
jgi:exopolyphosphatase/guanosine-5'-triphosphate,3'-diphosphate pyrophosphatase